MRERKYTDYSGDVTGQLVNGMDICISIADKPDEGKTIEIAETYDYSSPFRVTLKLDKDSAIRLALRLLPPATMIQVAQMLTGDSDDD